MKLTIADVYISEHKTERYSKYQPIAAPFEVRGCHVFTFSNYDSGRNVMQIIPEVWEDVLSELSRLDNQDWAEREAAAKEAKEEAFEIVKRGKFEGMTFIEDTHLDMANRALRRKPEKRTCVCRPDFIGDYTELRLAYCIGCNCEMYSVDRRAKYCSNRCRRDSIRSNKAEWARNNRPSQAREPHTPRNCNHCNTEYTPKRSDSKFCSSVCRVKHHRSS